VALHFTERGKPMQNAFIESFNGKFRDECLNQNWFVDLGRHERRRRSGLQKEPGKNSSSSGPAEATCAQRVPGQGKQRRSVWWSPFD